MEKELRAPSGGYRRTNGSTDYERQEFVFMNINLARAYQRMNEPLKANAIMRRVVEKSTADGGLIAELYQLDCGRQSEDTKPFGAPTGASPMVGYGAVAFNLYVAERETLAKQRNPTALGCSSLIAPDPNQP